MSEDSTPKNDTRLLWLAMAAVLGGVSIMFIVRELNSKPSVAQTDHIAPDFRLPLPDFEFIERNGAPVKRDDLLGYTWIADFVFTSCAGPCPMMSRHMERLQTDLADIPDLKLVSFSVDPERDTPQVLTQYAERYNADPQRWLFLTGEIDAMYDVAIKGFRITVEEARQNNQIIHDTRFMLVDDLGNIRGYYDSSDAEAMKRLRVDTRVLGH